MTTPTTLLALAERVERSFGLDNATDVEIEVALFEPNDRDVAIRPNAAGTKVVYTTADGRETTHWAEDWTTQRFASARLLRARARATLQEPQP